MTRAQSVLGLLRQPSTWGGFGVLAALAGVTFEEWQAIAHAGAAVSGALAILLPESGARRD